MRLAGLLLVCVVFDVARAGTKVADEEALDQLIQSLLIKHGSFESTPTSQHIYHSPPGFGCKGKCVTIPAGEQIWGAPPAPDGKHLAGVQFDGSEIYQTVELQVGTKYQLTFQMRKRKPVDEAKNKNNDVRLVIKVTGGPANDMMPPSDLSWTPVKYDFTATAVKTTIGLGIKAPAKADETIFLDDIRLKAVVLPKPKPQPGCTASAKDMNEQNDMPGEVDFQKAITTQLANAGDGALYPDFPRCSLQDGSGEVTVQEAFNTDIGGWNCAVRNGLDSDVVVRVQTTQNHDNPNLDEAWDFYYFVPKGKTLMANKGKGGQQAVCRLCGAHKVGTLPGTDWNDIRPLEQASYHFQCARRCSASLYQHRNFNGEQVTISMNMGSLKAVGLDDPAKISSLKIYGERCQVRLYASVKFGGDGKKPTCTFEVPAGSESAAWDMDAMRRKCCNADCPSGQDCIRSAAIRDRKQCAPGSFNTNGNKPPPCRDCIIPTRNSITEAIIPAQAQHVYALQRLFKAMASILEE